MEYWQEGRENVSGKEGETYFEMMYLKRGKATDMLGEKGGSLLLVRL